MDCSPTLKKKAKYYGVPVQYLIMADLMIMGYSDSDAHIIAYGQNVSTWSSQKLKLERDRIVNLPLFKSMLETRKNDTSATGVIVHNSDLELIGAEETAREILRVASNMPEHSKERGEMFMKYADLIRRNDAVSVDEDPVRIWLPMQCHQCPLLAAYNKAKKKNGDEQVSPTEMEQIVNKINLNKVKKIK